ncbi:NAD(P)H-binding protein [Christiangramia aquimixticola]|uniref:NAD(P)H-binding protein n=1 Tax=Christiangramia aquimixticola TaxID=1697558 RepID=UPI003AA7AAFE
MKVAILGCGWLGLPLAKELISQNHEVKGSVTRMEKMSDLRKAGIIPYSIKLFEKGVQGDISSFLSGIDVLIVDIPPGLRKNPDSNFVKKIRNLVPYIEKAHCEKVIFISSTSVYPDEMGNPEYSEESKTDNSSPTAIQLRNAELLLLDNSNFQTSVLRFGGLIGENRHPIYHLAGRENISSPEAPVNLIHQKDCIRAISLLIKEKEDNSVWNLVYPEHPLKADYYTTMAKSKNLGLPQFRKNEEAKGKIISSDKIIRELDFEFKHPIS